MENKSNIPESSKDYLTQSNEIKLHEILNKLNIEHKATTIKNEEDIENLEGSFPNTILAKNPEDIFYLIIKNKANDVKLGTLAKWINDTDLTVVTSETNTISFPLDRITLFAIMDIKDVVVLIDSTLKENDKINFYSMTNNKIITITTTDMINYINNFDHKVIFY